MTTPLSKPVRRLTLYPHRGRLMVVSLTPGDVLTLRHARTRKEYSIPLAWCYDAAVKAHVLRERAEKKKAKKR